MKILICTHFFSARHLGGTEVLTLSLARRLRAAGHDVSVICATDWDTASSYQIEESDDVVEGIPVRRLHFNWSKAPDVFRYLYDNPEVERYLSAYLQEQQPDLMHVTSCYSLSGSVITAARRLGIPVVFTATDFWFLCARNTLLRSDGSLCSGPTGAWDCTRCMLAKSKVYRWTRPVLPEPLAPAVFEHIGRSPRLTRQRGLRGLHGNWQARYASLLDALGSVNVIVTASRQVRQLFIDHHGIPADRIVTSAYGLDTAWARGYEMKTPSAEMRLGFIGQLIPMKGADILVRAVRSMPDEAGLRLHIYGDLEKDKQHGQTLKALAGDDARIEFRGTFPNQRMGEVLSSIDALGVPSRWFDFPLVIPSAFATKTPVLATDMPGMNELVTDEVNGLLFRRDDWRHLAQQIRRLVESPELVARLKGGIEAVKTTDQMAAEYVDLYRSLIPVGQTVS